MGGLSGKYPMRFFTSSGCSSTSKPATLAVPSVGGRKQVNMRIVVVLPAPLGPRNPTTSPFCTSNEMWSTAVLRAYFLVRSLTLIMIFEYGSGRDEVAPLGYFNNRNREKHRRVLIF